MVEADKAKRITNNDLPCPMSPDPPRRHPSGSANKRNFSIFDESDQVGRSNHYSSCAVTKKATPLWPETSSAEQRTKAAEWAGRKLAGAVYRSYENELRNLNAMVFDDLLVQSGRLLVESSEVRAKWGEKAAHLVVDEFQHTNRLQLELINQLAGAPPPNICVVGDDDQSIYGWRGADVSNLLEFEKHFPNPRIIRLEQNYRSTNTILGAANRLISFNSNRRGKKLWSSKEGGDPVRVVSMPDDGREAEFVVQEIAARLAERGLAWEEFAIAYRMNAQSRLLEENLRRSRIPYRRVGGKSFFERREIKDLTAYMSLLLNPGDDTALLRIINVPPRGIGAGTVQLALAFSVERKLSLFDALRHPDHLPTCTRKTAEAIRAFVEGVESARLRIYKPGADCATVISAIMERCGYFEDLRRSCKEAGEAESRRENVKEMLRALGEHQRRSRQGLQSFLDEVSLDRERSEEKETAAGVTLITLHAVKGLEFPHVFLIGAEDGLLPHERSKRDGVLDEERRLFYVGMTRPMRSLVITWCRARGNLAVRRTAGAARFWRKLAGDPWLRGYGELANRPMETEEVAVQFAPQSAIERKISPSRKTPRAKLAVVAQHGCLFRMVCDLFTFAPDLRRHLRGAGTSTSF